MQLLSCAGNLQIGPTLRAGASRRFLLWVHAVDHDYFQASGEEGAGAGPNRRLRMETYQQF